MAKDAELDRLGAIQNAAFEKKQAAQKAQEAAWTRRRVAAEAQNAAFEEKDRAYRAQQSSWESLQRMRDSYGPQIERLNSAQDQAFRNMGAAFDNASSAHDRRDGAGAKRYAEEGHTYKAESKRHVEERRRLVAELRSAAATHQTYTPALQAAKERFNNAKREFDAAKTAHERALAEYKSAKAAFDSARKAFQARLAIVKAENAKRADEKRSIAERAGVPYQYRDKVYTKKDADGTIQIYFGGIGEPNGPGHGHYSMDRSGKVTYKRDPFDPHGKHNFEDEKEAALLYTRSARSGHTPSGTNEHGGIFWKRDSSGTVLHITQYFADNYHVSWDATPSGNSNIHWTNKNVPKGHPDRFTAPSDASLR